MRVHDLRVALPSDVVPPLRFREKGRVFEGEVDHPADVVEMFEPIDVLGGAIELVDQRGVVITIDTSDGSSAERNEYPENRQHLFYTIHE